MKIAIDATNIKAGGGLTHLSRILQYADLQDIEVTLIGGPWLKDIPDRHAVKKLIFVKEFSSLWRQEYFKKFGLPKLLMNADVVFVPGGTFSSKKVPYVSMSQNMLVFEETERNRFPSFFSRLRYRLLEKVQVNSFKNAEGVIYISNYAKNFIERKYPALSAKSSTVIYHGISDDFRQLPKEQLSIEAYTEAKPLKLLYVSIVNYYKHQWNVVEAVKKLRKKGYPVELHIVGSLNKSLVKEWETVLAGTQQYIKYEGKVAYEEIANKYKEADIFIFASTCENMPNILVEAMSAGLPILCSDYGPMPEVLSDGGVYMDPLNIDDVALKLENVLLDPKLRHEIAQRSYKYALKYTWEKTSNETLKFITNRNHNLK